MKPQAVEKPGDHSGWCDRSVVTFAGQFASNIETGEEYQTLTLAELFTAEPGARAKGSGPGFIPSTYCQYDAREHARQRESGTFVALTGDIDHGDPSLEVVEREVMAFVGDAAWLIYSSANSRPGERRWRVIVPLDKPAPFALWHDAQNAFYDALEAGGLVMDRALARAAQPVWLPNVPPFHAKSGTALRGHDGAPLYFQRSTSGLSAPGLALDIGAASVGIAAIRRQRAIDERQRERIRREAEQRRAQRPQGDGASIIADFNASNSVASMLELCGYEQSPRGGADWRSPNQTGETYATRIIGDKWVSLSASDASAGIGEQCATGCFGDAYDLFVHYKHGGDHKAAFRALHAERRAAQPNVIWGNWAEPPPQEDGDPGWQEMPDMADVEPVHDVPDDGPPIGDPERGVSLADFRAYMPAHSYIFAPSGQQWPAASVNSRIPPVAIEGGKKINAATWLDQNRPVEQMTWAPGEPQIVANRLISDGGWIDRPDCNVFNLYRPPAKITGDPTKAGPWVEHIRRVYPDDAEHLISWLAHRVQFPHEKINHAIVMGGAQGVGKDTILEPVKAAIGPWNFAEVSPQHMLGRFNGFVKSVILRISEARDLGDVDRFAFYDHLKTYTAAPPDVLRVDEKHLREYSVFNVCGVIITTNHKGDGIYLPADDRRHYVAWSELDRDSFSTDYWADLYRWYNHGGTGHVAAYLASLTLDTFDAKAPPPKTTAFWDIVSSNSAPENAALADALDTIGNPDAVTIAAISAAASDEYRLFLNDRKNSRKIPHRLDECGYAAVRNRDAKDGLFKVNGRRCAIYARKTLTPHDQIEAAMRVIGQSNQ